MERVCRIFQLAMDVRQLKYFVAIVDAGSLSKAAQKLFIAQPSLSQQIAALEAELGTRLLLRSARGVKPTTSGSTLYSHARTVLRQMEHIRADVRKGSGSESGVVAVGLPTTAAAVLAAPLFEHVRERFPGIRLRIFESVSGYIGEMLANGQLDLALLFRDCATAGMSVIPVFDEELYVIGRRAGPARASCRLDTLAGIPLVMPSTGSGLRPMIERVFERAGVALNIIADIDSLPTLLAIAAGGSACTILPASVFAHHDRKSAVPMRRIVSPVMRRPGSVCWSHALPVSAAALAVRKAMIGLVGLLHTSGSWKGITLRPLPDQATLDDTGGPYDRFGRGLKP